MGKSGFDSKKFIRELEKGIKKSVESDLKKHPEKVLNDHVGEQISSKCLKCGHDKVTVIRGGYAKCPKCGHTAKVQVDLNWK